MLVFTSMRMRFFFGGSLQEQSGENNFSFIHWMLGLTRHDVNRKP
jgi:hypothetical protein